MDSVYETQKHSASSGLRCVSFGCQDVTFPSIELQQLVDSNNIFNNVQELRKKLTENGYLFFRNFHDREVVLRARLAVLEYMQSTGDNIMERGMPLDNGVLDSRCGKGCVPFMEGVNDITHSKQVLSVIEGQRPRNFFKKLFGEEELTFDFKWLRAMYNGGYTGAHVDNVYMARGTDQVLTMWTPLGDTPIEMGTLAVCEGSHNLPGFSHFQETYGSCDIEKQRLEGTGWFTSDPYEISKFGGCWKTSDFKAGDVLIFTLRTVHMSTANTTSYARVSCDTRWQPASQPSDKRFMGDIGPIRPKYGVFGEDLGTEGTTMEILKKTWGFL